jgi:predicted acetyltransferase
MPFDIRQLTPADGPAAHRLGAVAFGYADRPAPTEFTDLPGRTSWGVFDGERLVAKAVDRQQSHWYGGKAVAASGVAGVAVAAELRGRGVSRLLLTHMLAAARERGAAISTLFDSTPFPYRRLGWEECGVLQYWSVPTATLAGIRAPKGVTLRPATEADVPAMLALFNEFGQATNGLMARVPPVHSGNPAAVIDEFHGITLAVDDAGQLRGFCAWDRAKGYRAGSTLTVEDFIVTDADSVQALLAMIGSWASVVQTASIQLTAQHPALFHSAINAAASDHRDPWMLRVIDVEAAIGARGWSPHVAGSAAFTLDDPVCPWNSGSFRLSLAGGEATLEQGHEGAAVFDPRGLALWWANAASISVIRRAGLLTGGDPAADAFLDAATAGPAPMILDYF